MKISRFDRFVLKTLSSLGKKYIKQLPYLLLAIKLDLRIEKNTQKGIFVHPLGNRYILKETGFVDVERENAQEALRRLKVDHGMLQFEAQESERTSRAIITREKAFIEMLRANIASERKKSVDLQSLLEKTQKELEEQKFLNTVLEARIEDSTKESTHLRKKFEVAIQQLSDLEIKNINRRLAQDDKLGNKKKSEINKILSSAASAEAKLMEIEECLNSSKKK